MIFSVATLCSLPKTELTDFGGEACAQNGKKRGEVSLITERFGM